MDTDRSPLSVGKVARELGLNRDTVYRHIEAGHIKAFRIGSTIRVPFEEIERIRNAYVA